MGRRKQSQLSGQPSRSGPGRGEGPPDGPGRGAHDRGGEYSTAPVRLDQLKLGFPQPASLDPDPDYVRRLTDRGGEVSPVLVHGPTMMVVEGADRVIAAHALGHTTIGVEYFAGSEEEAYVEAVRRHVALGRRLSRSDREQAASRILGLHADWSDRLVAEICGLSPKTVASVRRSVPRETGGAEARVGRDGKRRPIDPASTRARIAELLEQRPGASLRSIARSAGASPATVRDVRKRVEWGESPVPPALRTSASRRQPAQTAPAPRARAAHRDPSSFSQWFDNHAIADRDWQRYVAAVPVRAVEATAAEARRRAATWKRFADSLESRTKQRKGAEDED